MVTVEEVRMDIIPVPQSGSPDSANHTANANREKNVPDIPVVPEKLSGDVYTGQKYGQRGSPDSANHAGSTNREETFPVVQEKPSEDGYNWRKYGQKNIKGNRNIRSYYRCSYQKCLVKKQVERAPDGRITDTSYFGFHDHPKPQTGVSVGLPSVLSMKVQSGDKRSSIAFEEKSPRAHAHALPDNNAELKETNELAITPIIVEGAHDIASPSSATKDYGNSDDNVAAKRQKTGDEYDTSMGNKPKSRWVVETISAVDVVNDGFRWRKYGQKLVKDNPNARSYYRCTNPGCPAKKRVERASHDPKVVITTYDCHHDHDVPQGRTLLPHSNSPAPNIFSGHNNNSVSPKDAIRAHQSNAAISTELANTTKNTDEKDNTPEEVNPAQTSAAICKQGRLPTDELVEEVNQTRSSTAINQVNTVDHPVEKDNAAAEVKQAKSSAPKEEQGKTLDLLAKNDGPPEEVNQNESSEPIFNQEQQGKTIDQPEEVNQAQNSGVICKREEGNTIDHSAEKKDPLEEADQARSIETSCKQEAAEETADKMI